MVYISFEASQLIIKMLHADLRKCSSNIKIERYQKNVAL